MFQRMHAVLFCDQVFWQKTDKHYWVRPPLSHRDTILRPARLTGDWSPKQARVADSSKHELFRMKIR